MQLKLTDQQIETAAVTIYNRLTPSDRQPWIQLEPITKNRYLETARQAAYHLQNLIEPPYESDVSRFIRSAGPYLTHCNDPMALASRILSDFVDARNGHSGPYPAAIGVSSPDTLHDEQIEAAAKAMYAAAENCASVVDNKNHPFSWINVTHGGRERYRMMARVAAPHLQIEWAEPTEDEESLTRRPDQGAIGQLREFVRRRNYALYAHPDPRLDRIEAILLDDRNMAREVTTRNIAEQILEILDQDK